MEPKDLYPLIIEVSREMRKLGDALVNTPHLSAFMAMAEDFQALTDSIPGCYEAVSAEMTRNG